MATLIKASSGGLRSIARRSTSTGVIADTETVMISTTLPADSLAVGDIFTIGVAGIHTNTTTATTATYRVRIGPTTLTGAIVANLTYAYGATARTNVAWRGNADIAIRAIGASGAAIGIITVDQSTAQQQNAPITASVTIDTTVDNLIEFTYQSGGATTTETAEVASIERSR